ncbi:MAG: hypothetical protein ACE5HS_22775, partial [bacterium]
MILESESFSLNAEESDISNLSKTCYQFILSILLLVFFIPKSNLSAQTCESTPVTVGYRTFSYAGSLTGYPTEAKPESKLWWNDGSWWGILWDPALNMHRIHKFDVVNQCWTSVGPDLDNRPHSSADVLWDE